MSHFTKITTELRDGELLKLALKDLGLEYAEGGLSLYSIGGEKVRMDLVVTTEGKSRVGFRKNGETYELVGDFYGLKTTARELLGQVLQRYAYHAIVAKSAEQGYQLVTEEKLRDGSIRLVVERWD